MKGVPKERRYRVMGERVDDFMVRVRSGRPLMEMASEVNARIAASRADPGGGLHPDLGLSLKAVRPLSDGGEDCLVLVYEVRELISE